MTFLESIKIMKTIESVTLSLAEFERLTAAQKPAKLSAAALRLDADYKNWDALPVSVIASMLAQRPTAKLKLYSQARFAGELDKFMAKKAAIGIVAPYALHVAGFAIGSKINHDLAEKAKTLLNGLAGFVQFEAAVLAAQTAFLIDEVAKNKEAKFNKNGTALGLYGAFLKLQCWIADFNTAHVEKLHEAPAVAKAAEAGAETETA